MDAVLNDIVLVVIVLMGWMVAAMAWWLRTPPDTLFVIFSVFLGLALTWSVPRYVRALNRFRRLRLGLDGERTVAENLDLLRADGHVVLHDLVGPGFNVDHVVVGPTGIYAVETKTLRKSTKGNPRIAYDGQTVLVDGCRLPRDPLDQARGQARWLGDTLKDMTSHAYEVRAVVAFPGWFVDQRGRAADGSWVLEPKALSGFVAKEPRRLAPEDVSLIVNRLKLLLRTTGAPAASKRSPPWASRR